MPTNVTGSRDWKLWARNKIWVKNSTGNVVRVLVSGSSSEIDDLVIGAPNADALRGVATLQADLGVALAWVAREREHQLAADELLPADHGKFDHFEIGKSDCVFVTAYVEGSSEVICYSLPVPPRHSIELTGSGKTMLFFQVLGNDAFASLIAGNDDRPAAKDSLGIGPVAEGTAKFLLHPGTAATTLAVYARWGSGKAVSDGGASLGGLVVEVTQRLEEKLGHKQRRLMRGWWIFSPWDFMRLLLVPMRLLAAFAYNWQARRLDVITRCCLPVLLVLAVVGVCMGVGIWELQQKASNATNPAAVTNGTAAMTNGTTSTDTSTGNYADTKVMKDLRLLRKLLCKSLKPFRSGQDAGCLQRLRACSFAALWHAMTQCMAFLMLCCCACCMRTNNKRALKGTLLPTSAQVVPSMDDDVLPRVAVFIDDLDRCKPTKIIEVLEAINLVLAGSGFVVVVVMDKDFILSAIQSAYKDVEIMKQETKAAEFLDKIVQVDITLPTPAGNNLRDYLVAQGVQGIASSRSTAPTPAASTHQATLKLKAREHFVAQGPASSSSTASTPAASAQQAAMTVSSTCPCWPGQAAASTARTFAASRQQDRYESAEKAAESAGFYSKQESELLWCWHRSGLLLDATPRDLKRMLNCYLLAKYISTARAQHVQVDHNTKEEAFPPTEEPKLMTLVLLWWKYPLAMCELNKMLQPSTSASAAECMLVDLLESYHQGLEPSKDVTGQKGADADPGTTSGLVAGQKQPEQQQQEDTPEIVEAPKQVLVAVDAEINAVTMATDPRQQEQGQQAG